jgi:hypothetical protein
MKIECVDAVFDYAQNAESSDTSFSNINLLWASTLVFIKSARYYTVSTPKIPVS